jgi:hypothetical protein
VRLDKLNKKSIKTPVSLKFLMDSKIKIINYKLGKCSATNAGKFAAKIFYCKLHTKIFHAKKIFILIQMQFQAI